MDFRFLTGARLLSPAADSAGEPGSFCIALTGSIASRSRLRAAGWRRPGSTERLRFGTAFRGTSGCSRPHEFDSLAAFSDDDQLLLSASYDCTLRVWRVTEAATLKIYRQEGYVTAAAMSHDGTAIASGGADGVLRSWAVPFRKVPEWPQVVRDTLTQLTTAQVDEQARATTP